MFLDHFFGENVSFHQFDPTNTPKCYTWLESYGSSLRDGKNKKNIFSSCEASDFRGRSQTDFLHDLEARHISPWLRCFNRKITKKLHATCKTRHLFWLVIFPPCYSRQGPPLWNWGIFDNFRPLPTTLNVIWLQKVVPNLPFSYLGKVKKNWQLFPLIFFGESQKYDRGGGFRPPPHPIGLKDWKKCESQVSQCLWSHQIIKCTERLVVNL